MAWSSREELCGGEDSQASIWWKRQQVLGAEALLGCKLQFA